MPSYKVIKSGHIVEIYKYDCAIDRRMDDTFLSRNGGRDKAGEGEKGRKEEYKKRVGVNALNKLRRLINANFDENSLFVTLTYAENMQDLEKGAYDLKKFVQKMKRRQKDFQYVAVLEFQKRGAIHYHMLCNYRLEWNTHEELQSHERKLGEVWANGFVDIGYKKNDNAGAYLLKYMTKANEDSRMDGKKRYFFSRSLKQPEELTAGEARLYIDSLEGVPPVFTNSYYSEFHGNVHYAEYNPKRYDLNLFLEERAKNEEKCLNAALEMFGGIVEEC